jgi:glucuronosyltransferase
LNFQQIFGEVFASIEEQERKAALLLVNSHPITNSPHANLPNVIEVGGIHLTPAKPLDKVEPRK